MMAKEMKVGKKYLRLNGNGQVFECLALYKEFCWMKRVDPKKSYFIATFNTNQFSEQEEPIHFGEWYEASPQTVSITEIIPLMQDGGSVFYKYMEGHSVCSIEWFRRYYNHIPTIG